MKFRHPIDRLVRRKLTERSFNKDEAHLEEMRTILEARDQGEVVAVGRTGRWWKVLLFPVAGLVWWAWARTGTGPIPQQVAVSQSTHQQQVDGNASVSEGPVTPAAAWPATTPERTADPATDPSTADAQQAIRHAVILDAGSAVQPHARAVEQVHGALTEESARITSGEESATTEEGRSADQPNMNGEVLITADQGAFFWGASSDGNAGGSSSSGGRTGEVEESGELDHADATSVAEPTPVQERKDALPADRPASGEFQREVEVDVLEVIPVRGSLLQPQLNQALIVVDPSLRTRHVNELHVFASALSIRAADRRITGSGTLLGLEYRMRKKQWSIATGIHWNDFEVDASNVLDGVDAGDVTLSYLEVPILAGYEIGVGRIGVALQAGVSLGLLFNASGNYLPESSLTITAVPDEAFRTTNYAVLLRPQLSYQVNELVRITTGPFWKRQMSEVATLGPLNDVPLNDLGISLGVVWKLRRTSF